MNNTKIKVGITGQPGFMGTHLYNYLGLKKDVFERIPFADDFFNNAQQLQEFAGSCDVVVHLAAMNRHGDPQVIYNTNIELVKKVIDACEQTNSKPHILFSSSTQEERDNLYGKSKRDGRKLFESWAQRNKARFTGLVIPNVFGPFGHPYYNSVVATFCHQLTHDETPKIEVDGELKLIYINELVEEITQKILDRGKERSLKYEVPHRYQVRVSEILQILEEFKTIYFEQGNIPDINTPFRLVLFTTFRCYMPHDKFPFAYKLNTDSRGSFVELIRANTSGQSSYSTTNPGITRGNHFHTRKVERFAVIKGKARIQLRKTGTSEIIEYFLDGEKPSFVDMPIWYTHNITNVGDEELLTMFWINEPYDPVDPDTYFEEV
ncbi:MAG: NAD-dependent epimerase/dehydratase family protein [Bacteroidales bacterium]|nr:NAD-dependent epimerase/dehydratase family protein [Bacteroidales bacterium]